MPEPMPPLALLAGGFATRLGPITERVPKSLLEIAGTPFIAHQLRLLADQGVTNVILCCGHLGEMIADFVGNGSRFGCSVQYSFDGPRPLRTGGAIRKALPLLGSTFWVMYGDSYLTASFAPVLRAFRQSGDSALMTVFRNQDRWDKSNVYFSAGRIVRYSKQAPSEEMRHIDYGLGIYTAESFAVQPVGAAFDLAELQANLIARAEMGAFEVESRFYEIGSPRGLAETDAFLRQRAFSCAGFAS